MTTVEIVEKKDRREGKGRVIALSRRVYRIVNTDVFYVESESNDEMYYYVMFDTTKEFEWCSCKDFERSRYQNKCKHLYGVEYAIKFGTVNDTENLPSTAKKDNSSSQPTKSWRDDDYGF
jgi:predicted nucleic acid-binding Zn finger protein